MSRIIKFRAWSGLAMYFPDELIQISQEGITTGYIDDSGCPKYSDHELMQYTGLKDENGKEIYFDDILRFSDKWEWYKGEYGIKMMFAGEEKRKELQAKYDAEPYEERVVGSIEDYEWLLSSEIQRYWEIIGNIHENPELLKDTE